MKIAAMVPNFVIESPPGEEVKSAERTRRHLALAKVGGVSETSVGTDGGHGSLPPDQQETRNGLTRLAEFISRQRRAPEHLAPEPPTEALRERPVFDSSHEYTKIIVAWSQRPVATDSMARVIAGELERRRGLKAYKRMIAEGKKKPTQEKSVGDADSDPFAALVPLLGTGTDT